MFCECAIRKETCERAVKDISLKLETLVCTTNPEVPPREAEIPIPTKLRIGGTVPGNKVDARASHFKYFVRSGLGAPYLSMPRRQSMLLVFEFARLVPFVAPNVVGFSLANPQSTFRICKVELVRKCQKKIAFAAKKNLWFKIKNLHDAHQFFDQSTLEMVTYVFLSVE